MKMKYNQPIVEVIGLKPSCAILAGSVPTFSGVSIPDEGGPQGDAR